jgi:hypothetical protein
VPINPQPYLLSATSLKPFARQGERIDLECAAEPRVRPGDRDAENPRTAVLEPCGYNDGHGH